MISDCKKSNCGNCSKHIPCAVKQCSRHTPCAVRVLRHTERAYYIAPLFLAFLIGCGAKDPSRPKVHPVQGRISIAGKPAAGVQVVLCEKEQNGKAYRPHGVTDADGVFRLTTFKTDDGAPDGEYAVIVTWPAPPVKGQGEDEFGPDRLGSRYADIRRPAAQVKITAETSELAPLDLK